MEKQASSHAAWAILTEGVSSSRIEAHRIRHLVNRGLKVVQSLPKEQREEFWRMAGDLLSSIPDRLTRLEEDLDRTSYTLAVLGKDFFEGRLSLTDRTMVDDAIESTSPFVVPQLRSHQRVALRYLLRKGYAPPVSELPGVQTLVTPTSEQNLPSNTSKPSKDQEQPFGRPATPEHKEQALPITQEHKRERDKGEHIPPGAYNTPGPAAEGKPIKMRTPGEGGEQYDHPSVGPRITPKRRPMEG